jgi:hypothetical protein
LYVAGHGLSPYPVAWPPGHWTWRPARRPGLLGSVSLGPGQPSRRT